MNLNRYVGLPYQERGRSFEGVDCWGLACLVYADRLGVLLPSYDDAYQHIGPKEAADLERLIRQEKGIFAPEEDLEPLDLVLFRIGGAACHIGIYAGQGRVLHIQAGHDSCIEYLDGPRWKPRIEGYYRYVG